MSIICTLLFLYWIVLLVRVLSSWFPRPPAGPIAQVLSLVFALTEPVLRPVRGLIPPLRVGMLAMDISPLLVFIVLGVLRASVC